MDISINVTSVVEDVSNSGIIDLDAIFIPTRAEKGIIKLRKIQSTLTESIIQDISAITLDNSSNSVVNNLFGTGDGLSIDIEDIPDTDGTIRPQVLNAISDIIFGNDPSAVSFIVPKSKLGLTLDSTNLAKDDLDPTHIKFFNNAQIINVEETKLEEIGTFSALSQTGHTITYTSSEFGSVSFLRLSDRTIQYSDNLNSIDLSGSVFDSSNSIIIEEDTNKYVIISNIGIPYMICNMEI